MMDLGGSIRRRRRGAARGRKKGRERPAGRKPRAKKGTRTPGKGKGTPGKGQGRARGAGTGATGGRLRRIAANAWVAVLAVAGAGLGLGYLVAITIMFPAPDTPVEVQAVPDLRGQPAAVAFAVLADSGLAVGRVDSVRHPTVPTGVVMGQSPLPGPTALLNAAVRVTVSSGPEVRPVPDLTRLDGGRAAELLAAGGFLVEVDTVESTVAAGRVMGMDPAPGTEVSLPGRVRVAVSRGPPTFPMPDLAGTTQGEAFALLRALGLELGEVDRRYSLLNVGLIFGQFPEPRELVTRGTQVNLIVGREVARQ